MRQTFDLDGRVAIVTGGGQGLGRSIALGLIDYGAAVAIIDLDMDASEETASEIRARGGQGVAIAADVSRPDAVANAFEQFDIAFDQLDILINNVGIQSHQRPEALGLAEWERVMAVNIGSYLLCSQAAYPRMVAGGRGSIVNLASITGVTAVGRGNLAYSVSKAGVLQLTRELAVEWASAGIRVNALLPCQFKTRLLQRTIDRAESTNHRLVEHLLAGIPIGRFGEPEDLVGPVLLLASDAGAMITGVSLPVDGGNLALNAGGGGPW